MTTHELEILMFFPKFLMNVMNFALDRFTKQKWNINP